MKKSYSPTVRHALKKARADMDGPGDTVGAAGDKDKDQSTSTAHESEPDDTDDGGVDTV